MASTRRSTRQLTATAPKYAESDSEPDVSKSKGKKATRRKRAREDDDDVENEDSSPPKKAPKSEAAPSKPKPTKSTPSKSKPTSSKGPPPVSSANRDSEGNQQVYWLLKAEPLPRYENGQNVSFSIDDLASCTAPEPWSGVRNPQARNNMQAMRAGDLGFFYHSNAKPSGIAGILRVVKEAEVDESAFDPKDAYFDPKSRREEPKWWCVGVEFVRKFDEVVDLKTLKGYAEKGKGGPLEGMQLVTNSRLSVSRVSRGEWEFIMGLVDGKDGDAGGEDETYGTKENEGGGKKDEEAKDDEQ